MLVNYSVSGTLVITTAFYDLTGKLFSGELLNKQAKTGLTDN